MRRKLNCVPALLCLLLLACGVVSATPYSWNGGDGRWADSGKWTPNGVPGALDSVSFLVNSTQTVTVDANAALFSMGLDTGTSGAGQTFSIAPGVNLTLDKFTLASSQPTAVAITGGGRVALTNEALWVSSTANVPTSFFVSGPGTVLDMPKPAGSGLYIGAKEEAYAGCNDFFHVTACATVLVANATCIGNVQTRSDGTHFATRGRLLVDDGSHFYGGAILFVGRGYNGSAGNQCVCAVTNSTFEADMIDAGEGAAAVFVGSNAVVRAVKSISFPREACYARNMRMNFEDSYLTTGVFRVLRANGAGNQGRLARCRVDCNSLSGLALGARDSAFEIEDSTLHCKETLSTGGDASSNCVLRLVRTETVADVIDIGHSNVLESAICVEDGSVSVRNMRVGCDKMAENVRYEQDGGTFRATGTVLVGRLNSKGSRATFRGVDFSAQEIICGDNESWGYRPEDARMTFADMARCEAHLLVVGGGSIDACLLLTNTTATVTYSDASDSAATTVGKNAGATRNMLLLVDSAINQTGGHVYVGRYDYATNNTLRLVRSTYNFSTINNKGDVIVGYNSGARGSRMELLDHSTFTYDRAWMAVGHNAASNVWSMCGGSVLSAPNTQFWLGGSGSTAVGNRLVLGDGSSFTVKTFGMKYGAVLEVSGACNVMTLANDITISDGCSYLFRPGAEASTTPMLTINRKFSYSANQKIYVDVANAGIGRHVLLTSSSTLTEPVAGSSVIFQNVPRNCSVRVFRSEDTKSLVCTVAPTGTTIIFR